MALECEVLGTARRVLASISRTEDVAFSPDGATLAIADFGQDEIAFFTLELPSDGPVRLTDGVRLACPELAAPHGLTFIGNDHVVVASREGAVALFEVPRQFDGESHKVDHPVAMLGDGPTGFTSPGSVAARSLGAERFDVLVCYNYAHVVTRYELDLADGVMQGQERPAVQKWMDIPDGVCFSADGQWLAVSNHNMNAVLLYRNDELLGPASDPDGIARGVAYPHGLFFSPDGSALFVADAGTPYVHVYRRGAAGWNGVHFPVASTRVIDDVRFHAGRAHPDGINTQEGGPKGIDLHPTAPLVAITCEEQVLSFATVEELSADDAEALASAQVELDLELHRSARAERQERDRLRDELRDLHVDAGRQLSESAQTIETVRQELAAARRAAKAEVASLERRIDKIHTSRSWRWSTPLRRLGRMRRVVRGGRRA